MQGILKKIGLFLIILSVCWTVAGALLWKSVRAYSYEYIQQNISRYSDTLKLTYEEYDQLNWLKKNEVRHGDKMFDIKKIIPSESSILLVGYFDEKDDFLFELLFELLGDQDSGEINTFDIFTYVAILPIHVAIDSYPHMSTFLQEYIDPFCFLLRGYKIILEKPPCYSA